jgi:hypothetical protein
MRNFENISLEEILAKKNNIEITISEEKAKVVAIESEKDKIYELMIEKFKKDLTEINNVWKELKIRKFMFNTEVKFLYKLNNEVVKQSFVGFYFREDKKTALIDTLVCNNGKNLRISAYDKLEISGWEFKENIAKIYAVWNDAIKVIKQQLADEYINMKNKEVDDIINKYNTEKLALAELKQLFVG